MTTVTLVRRAVLVGAASFALISVRPATAGDLVAAFGAGGSGSSWRGDAAVFSQLKFGYRGWDLIAPYFLVKLGYASVDDRLLTVLSLGVQVWGRWGRFRPYLRVGGVHAHEEPWPAVREQPWGATFGIGDGIRHRAGVEGAIGFDVPVRRWGRKVALYLSAEATLSWLTFSSGPSGYWGGLVSVGVSYGL